MSKNNEKRGPTLTGLTNVVLDNPVSRWLRFRHWLNRFWTLFTYTANYVRSSLITKMILVSWILLSGAVIFSGGASYLVAMPALEDEIKYTGKTTVTTFASSNVILFQEEDGATLLQLYLDNIMQADVEDGRILDAIVFDKNLKVLARKDKTKVNEEGITKRWKHLKGISSVRIDKDEKSFVTIAAPVIYSEDTDPVGFVVFIFSQAPVEKAKAEIIRVILILLGLMIVVGGAYIGWILWRRLSPVRKVTEAFEAMNEGNFDVEVEVRKGNDEVVKLAIATKRHQGIQKRGRTYLHPIAQLVVEGKIPDKPWRKNTIVFFTDIVGSTARQNLYGSQHVHDINNFLYLVEEWGKKFGALTFNYTGDGNLMAIGALEGKTIGRQEAQQAFMCIVGLQTILFEHAYCMKELIGPFPMLARIGISTGSVDFGRIGSSLNAMGNTVNYAARLLALSEEACFACDNHLLINASETIQDGEEVPEDEVVMDEDTRKHTYVIAVGPTLTWVKGLGDMPMFHGTGLRSPKANEKLAKHLNQFRQRPDILAILEKGLDQDGAKVAQGRWEKLLSETIRLRKPPSQWILKSKKKEREEPSGKEKA